jgi:HlyD family secretion protein
VGSFILKKSLIIAGALLVVSVLVSAVWMHGRSLVHADPPITVRAEPVGRSDIVEIVSAPGTVDAKTLVQISAKVSARIIDMPVIEGQTVTKGNPSAHPPVPPSVLVRLDAADLESDLRGAQARYSSQVAQIEVAQQRLTAEEAQIASTQVEVDDALRDLKRQQGLLATADVSQGTVDTAQAKYDELRHQLAGSQGTLAADRANLNVMRFDMEAADAEIARAQEELSYTVITAPIDGTVTGINAQVGEMVVTGTMNNPGTELMEVADLNEMIVKARVDESAIAQVQIGQVAKVRCMAYPDRVFDGVVRSVSLSQSKDRTQQQASATPYAPFYECEILLKADGQRLFCGLSADADIEVHRNKSVLNIPSQAVLDRRVDELPPGVRDSPEVDKTKTYCAAVYRVIDGKAVVTPVTIGPSNLTHTMIKSGLSEGQTVIIGPFKILQSLANDAAVKLEAATTQPAPPTKSATEPTSSPS